MGLQSSFQGAWPYRADTPLAAVWLYPSGYTDVITAVERRTRQYVALEDQLGTTQLFLRPAISSKKCKSEEIGAGWSAVLERGGRAYCWGHIWYVDTGLDFSRISCVNYAGRMTNSKYDVQ